MRNGWGIWPATPEISAIMNIGIMSMSRETKNSKHTHGMIPLPSFSAVWPNSRCLGKPTRK